MSRGLSQLQRNILVDIANRANSHGVAVWAPSRGHNHALRPHERPGLTRSESAVLSRALARLVDRGLVERVSGFYGTDDPGSRTSAVRLTKNGVQEMKRLTIHAHSELLADTEEGGAHA